MSKEIIDLDELTDDVEAEDLLIVYDASTGITKSLSATEVVMASVLGTAAVVDVGTDADNVPQNSDLGTAAYKDTGTASGDVAGLETVQGEAGLPEVRADQLKGMFRWRKGSDIASASALTLGTGGNFFDVTGTTSITSISTSGVIGTRILLQFDGVLTLTYHATDLILPGKANIITAAGDIAEFIEYASGDWMCLNYTRASGYPVKGLVLLESITASAQAEVDFDSGNIDGTYDEYEVRFQNVIPAADAILAMRVNDDSGANDYNWVVYARGSDASAPAAEDAADTEIQLSGPGTVGSDTNETGASGVVHIIRPSASEYTQIYGEILYVNQGGHLIRGFFGGSRLSAAAVTTLQFLFLGPTNTTSGEYKLYGVSK